MKSTILLSVVLTLFICLNADAQASMAKKTPKMEELKQADAIAKRFFELLKKNEIKALSEYIVEGLGSSWDDTKKIQARNDYTSKFEMIALRPPKGVYGIFDGYDMIEQGFLFGSDRYFRNTYIGYFEESVLLFEFRFYVNSKNKVMLNYVGWSDKNPFEYMSTSDMLLPKYER